MANLLGDNWLLDLSIYDCTQDEWAKNGIPTNAAAGETTFCTLLGAYTYSARHHHHHHDS